jgi:hypothetical protein
MKEIRELTEEEEIELDALIERARELMLEHPLRYQIVPIITNEEAAALVEKNANSYRKTRFSKGEEQ